MSGDGTVIPEYGHGGDYTGARRQRRAFRFAVVAVLALSGGLWITESYIRYDQADNLYRMSLTLHPDSARALLRNAVLRDSELHEKPTSRYVEALADIEEIDEISHQYARAHELNPTKPALLIKYGCHLFLTGDYRAARERFREAGVHPPHNKLARYLEAAALAIGDPDDAGLEEAFALLARTNDSSAPLEFPLPLWHASLPEDGYQYSKRRRELVDLTCAPLYRFRDLVMARAPNAIRAGQIQVWEQRIVQLSKIGRTLVGSRTSPAQFQGTSQAFAGLQFQIDAIQLRKLIAEVSSSTPDTADLEHEAQLKLALAMVRDFEETRDTKIAVSRMVVESPRALVLIMAGLLLLGMAILKVIDFVFFPEKRSDALPLNKMVVRAVIAAQVAAMGLLLLLMALPDGSPDILPVLGALKLLWYALFAALIGIGLIFPRFQLALPKDFILQASEESQEYVLPSIRAAWRNAYFSLVHRYAGFVFGSYLMMISVWWMTFRILEGVYPLQLVLLVQGLTLEERAIVLAAQNLLG